MTVANECWQGLMDRAYAKWQGTGWSYRQFLLNLDAVERKAVILGNFNYQVGNGGAQQYVDNGYASGSGRELLDILDEIDTENARRVTKIVREILKYVRMDEENNGFGHDYWKDEWIDDEPPAWMDELDKLTDEYYEFNDDFMTEVEAYLVSQSA